MSKHRAELPSVSSGSASEASHGAVGKRSRTDALIQRRVAPAAAPASAGPTPVPVATGGDDPFGLHLHGSSSGGLPDGVRGKMEQSFDADFSSVRVHEGGAAQAIGAVAFAQGNDVHFAPGQFQPTAPAARS